MCRSCRGSTPLHSLSSNQLLNHNSKHEKSEISSPTSAQGKRADEKGLASQGGSVRPWEALVFITYGGIVEEYLRGHGARAFFASKERRQAEAKKKFNQN